MKYYSTNNRTEFVRFRDAVLSGLAPDGGLYMPEYIPELSDLFFKRIEELTFTEIAKHIAEKFVGIEIKNSDLEKIISDAINFKAPVIPLDSTFNVLELFHGPTLAFKDFGARFMSRTMEYFLKGEDEELNILVATSGDTGSAVANGFLGVEGINVYVLYPSGKISEIQEKQITTLGKNITALEIEGTFDDCQQIVKQAFLDKEILEHKKISSANSINIARLIPQMFYYFEAAKKFTKNRDKVIFSVPSGNLGNLTAGLISKKMGLPVSKFISAVNSNDTFPEYLNTGKFNPRPSIQTYSNAMDVGNPNNLQRINELFGSDVSLIKNVVFSESFNDAETLHGIKEIKEKFNYVIDPHGAVGYLAAKSFQEEQHDEAKIIILETAHPSKFIDVVQKSVDAEIEIPERLEQCLDKEKKAEKLSAEYSDFKNYFLST